MGETTLYYAHSSSNAPSARIAARIAELAGVPHQQDDKIGRVDAPTESFYDYSTIGELTRHETELAKAEANLSSLLEKRVAKLQSEGRSQQLTQNPSDAAGGASRSTDHENPSVGIQTDVTDVEVGHRTHNLQRPPRRSPVFLASHTDPSPQRRPPAERPSLLGSVDPEIQQEHGSADTDLPNSQSHEPDVGPPNNDGQTEIDQNPGLSL